MSELTDIESVRQFLQKSAQDKLQDDDITVLIRQASPAITRYCRREFTPTAGATRSFELACTGGDVTLDLSPYELRVMTEVIVDPPLSEYGAALAASHYRLRPFPSRDGTFFSLRFRELPVSRETREPFASRRVDITGDWGLASIPGDVQHACNLTVEAWLYLRRGMNNAGGEVAPLLGALPAPARDVLRPWVRPEALV